VSPTPLSELILRMKLFATDPARQLPSFFDIQLDPQFVVGTIDGQIRVEARKRRQHATSVEIPVRWVTESRRLPVA